MKKVVKQIALLCCALVFTIGTLTACTTPDNGGNGNGNNDGGTNNSTTQTTTPGEVAGFELPHTTGQANSNQFYNYNSELFYLNETRISGADPGALYVSYSDIDNTYEKYQLSYKYYDEATATYEWIDGMNEEKFIAENGTVEDWYEMYGDYYYMIVTGGGGNSSFQMWRSHDLVRWEECGRAASKRAISYDSSTSWTTGDCSWAPEFVYDKATGLYFIWFSMNCKDGNNNTTTLSPNSTTTGYTYDGLTLSCAYSINPLGPYKFATTKEVLEFQAMKTKEGKVVTGTEEKSGPNLDRDIYDTPDAYFYEIFSREGDVIGYKAKDGTYYNLHGYELTTMTPVMNVSYYYPRMLEHYIKSLEGEEKAALERKLNDFENKYHLRNLYGFKNTDVDKYLWPAIDSNPVIDEFGNRYLYFSQHISSVNPGNNVWVVKMLDWLTPDWTTLTHISTPGYVSIIQDGSFEGILGEPTYWSEGSINEGTEVLYHNGKWYFTYSPFGLGSREYSPYIGISDNPLGPFTKLGTAWSPVIGIGTEDGNYMAGTGHHCFIQAGEELWILYHCFYNPVNNNDKHGNFLGRCIGADRAYWKYVPELGYDMMFGNGPTYNLQPKPETYTGYTNVAKYATITGNGDFGKIEYLTDGMVTSQPFSRQFEYGKTDGGLEISLKWETPVEITAFMIYNAGGIYQAFTKVDSVLLKLARRPAWYDYPTYNGYCYIKDLAVDPNDYLPNYQAMRKASAAIAEFNPIEITEMHIYLSGDADAKYFEEDEEGLLWEGYKEVHVPEIYIFGNEVND